MLLLYNLYIYKVCDYKYLSIVMSNNIYVELIKIVGLRLNGNPVT